MSEAKARLPELARRVRLQHEQITLTRNGEAEPVLLSVDDLESLEVTLEILGDSEAVTHISESLAPLGRPVTSEPAQRYEIRFQPAARRAISEPLPEAVPSRSGDYSSASNWLAVIRRRSVTAIVRVLIETRDIGCADADDQAVHLDHRLLAARSGPVARAFHQGVGVSDLVATHIGNEWLESQCPEACRLGCPLDGVMEHRGNRKARDDHHCENCQRSLPRPPGRRRRHANGGVPRGQK